MSASPSPPTPWPSPWWLRALARLPLPVLRGAGWLLGAALWAGGGARRRVVWRNLALCFPAQPWWRRGVWTWRTFVHFGQAVLDRLWLWHAPAAVVAQRVRLDGALDALRQPGPVLVFAPHFMGLDAAWTRLTQAIQRRWAGMYAPQTQARLDAWVRAGRQRFGAPMTVSRHTGMRGLVRALRQGYAVYLLPDMDLGAEAAVFVPFFGVPAATVTSLGRLAALGSAPVVPVIARLDARGYTVRVLPPLQGFPIGDDRADAARMNEELQRWIMADPSQYHWLHRRFKTRPPGAPSLY
ncbi:Lipid A biosynthesis lauroyltransferase [Tepidimonas alkaliphilus]|uniref:Lipid A biosynthesis lauroyltransferase n=1 Tax=Tepidimonas alkaliphilus TaxID=2588942 RepID=A0A554W7U4_9BURK|nr:lysophospholipid acyltransferase family protein [Tepidimonas alkaliphilus]TSE19640.1 Lipid A biosynthesis lauroyltransferase [Tepidimonas alkaliphilus]